MRETLLSELCVARWLAHVLDQRPRLGEQLFRRFGQPLCEAVTEVVLGRKCCRELALNRLNYAKLLTTGPARDDRL